MALGLPAIGAETSGGHRFLGSSRASRCLPVPMHLWYLEHITIGRRKIKVQHLGPPGCAPTKTFPDRKSINE